MTPDPSQSASTSTEARLRGALQELFDFVADGWGDDYPDAMRRAESALASPPPAPEPDAASDREVIEALAKAMKEAGMIQREPKDAPGPPWPTVSPWSWGMAVSNRLAARGYRLVPSQPQSATLPRSGEPSDE